MKKKAEEKPILAKPSSDKLAFIRSGKKKKTITKYRENKNITFSNKEGKFVSVEKEKKIEEAGVIKQKRNFIKFETKLETEREKDLHKIGAAYLAQPKERIQEKIYIELKRNQYLDNYQYHETKNLKKAQPDTVIHKRLGSLLGGEFEETTHKKVTMRTRGGSADAKKGYGTKQSILKNAKMPLSAKKAKETISKVGRRGGAEGKTSTITTKKEIKTTTITRGGKQDQKASTKTTTTTTTRGRK